MRRRWRIIAGAGAGVARSKTSTASRANSSTSRWCTASSAGWRGCALDEISCPLMLYGRPARGGNLPCLRSSPPPTATRRAPDPGQAGSGAMRRLQPAKGRSAPGRLQSKRRRAAMEARNAPRLNLIVAGRPGGRGQSRCGCWPTPLCGSRITPRRQRYQQALVLDKDAGHPHTRSPPTRWGSASWRRKTDAADYFRRPVRGRGAGDDAMRRQGRAAAPGH